MGLNQFNLIQRTLGKKNCCFHRRSLSRGFKNIKQEILHFEKGKKQRRTRRGLLGEMNHLTAASSFGITVDRITAFIELFTLDLFLQSFYQRLIFSLHHLLSFACQSAINETKSYNATKKPRQMHNTHRGHIPENVDY